MKKTLAIIALAAILSGACAATPHVVKEQKISDADLSCNGLAEAIAEAERFKKEAYNSKFKPGNVAAYLLFMPAVWAGAKFGTWQEAIEAADDRMRHLRQLREKKGC